MKKILLCILFFPSCVFAQVILPLDSILNRIESNHPALKINDARIKELNTYAKGSITLPPPRVSGGFWMTPYNPKRWVESGAHGDGMGSFMVSGEQMLPNRQMQVAEGRYMASMSEIQSAEKSVMRNMLFSEAKTAYYNWVVLKQKIKVIASSKNLLQLMIESAKQRYQFNREKLGSIYKAETELSNLDRMLAMYTGEIRQQKIMLETLMQQPSLGFEIDTFKQLPEIPSLPDTNRIANRSDIRMIEAELNAARKEQEWQHSKLKPEFGIRYDHMFAFGGQPWQFSLMGMMTVPIAPWANKDIKARIEGIDFRLDAFNYQKSAIVNSTLGASAERLVMMQTLQDQISRYEKTVIPNQEKRFKSTLLAYEQNTDELFMVLDAWMELKMSRLAQLDLIQQLFNAKVGYEKELEIR